MKLGGNFKLTIMLDKVRAKEAYGYDEVMELVCRLPTSPAHVLLSPLARDMGYRSQLALIPLVHRAKERFSCVNSFTFQGRRCINLMLPDAAAVLRKAEAYWEMVHGKGYRPAIKPVWRNS